MHRLLTSVSGLFSFLYGLNMENMIYLNYDKRSVVYEV